MNDFNKPVKKSRGILLPAMVGATIGGLIVATFATLLFVPVVFSIVNRRRAAPGEVMEPSHA